LQQGFPCPYNSGNASRNEGQPMRDKTNEIFC
jgi:hypothetical protein